MLFGTSTTVGFIDTSSGVASIVGALIQYSGNEVMIDPLAEFGRAAESRTARWRGILSATRSSTS